MTEHPYSIYKPAPAKNRQRSGQMWSAERSRHISKRIVVQGNLILVTSAHLGNGDGEDLTDLPLLVDPLEDKPLLTGSSIAGALRSYLHSRTQGATVVDPKGQPVPWDELLFGAGKRSDNGAQSPLIVDDAIGQDAGVEVRDGVGLTPDTRTAAHDKLFSIETWHAGTLFPLRFELLVCRSEALNDSAFAQYVADLKQALVTALAGLTDGGITLGARKHRGYGKVRVDNWQVTEYNLSGQRNDLVAWLTSGLAEGEYQAYGVEKLAIPTKSTDLAQSLGKVIPDGREIFNLEATFALETALMIRGNSGRDDQGPDTVHLHTRDWNTRTKQWERMPILSGTSVAGALRARAWRIASTLCKDEARVDELIDCMFGLTEHASRVVVEQSTVDQAQANLVQSRIKIDRLTGGVIEGALFGEQPVFPTNDATLTLRFRLLAPKEHEVGLLLLLLKDLWTGDLPLGGTINIGRGRLHGISATLDWSTHGSWALQQTPKGLQVTHGNPTDLNKLVTEKLQAYLHKSVNPGVKA